MSVNTKRVFYVEYLSHPLYAEKLAARPDIQLDRLDNDTPDDTASAVLADAHVYQIGSRRDQLAQKYFADKELIARAPRLLAVSTHGAGFDTVNLQACTDAGVLAVNQAGGNREAVAEHALGMMLTLSKRIVEMDRYMRRNAGASSEAFMGDDLFGRTVGIVGLGNVGGRLAELCRGLFGMRVLAYDPYLSKEEIAARGAEKTDLEELLRQSDYVSIHCPLTDETRALIGAREYALMPQHAFFISTARGFIHDEDALADALAAKRIAGAGLDVWSREPPDPEHPLLRFDTVIASNHTAGVTRQARANIAHLAAEQVMAMFDGKRPGRILNPEVWPAYARRFETIFGFAPGV